MKFTFSWLLDYLETNCSVQEIAQALTFAGVEVESVLDNREKLKGFEVVYIKSISDHPNADKLKICQIDTSIGEQIVVCGANNVTKDIFAIWAPPGVIIPSSNMKVDIIHIRGQRSCGMLCSLHELCLEENQSNGIYLLNDNKHFVGENACDALKDFLDPVFDVSLTPNRIDCAGVLGIARLLSACGIGNLKLKKFFSIDSSFPSPIQWKIESGATFVAGCFVRNVKNCPSPIWIQRRLRAIGLVPKSALVDITNYILFDQNRPLHVYDADKLKGNILTIKQLNNSCVFQTLKMDTCYLKQGDIVVYDDEPIALAGIIGGQKTAVTNETSNIFIESAIFHKECISSTSNRLSLHTDSGYRFERGIDPEGSLAGLYFAINLIQSICGGLVSVISVQDKRCTSNNILSISRKEFESMVGSVDLWDDFLQVLRKLEYQIIFFDIKTITVSPPSYRVDIDNIYVLIEDYIRIRGMHIIHNATLPFYKEKLHQFSISDNNNLSIRKCVASRGFVEHIGFTFSNKKQCVCLENAISISNPISIDYSYMRQTLVFSLVFVALDNWRKGLTNIRLFEIGPIFDKKFINKQQQAIASIIMGAPFPCWKKNVLPYDIYDMKAEMIYFLRSIGYTPDLVVINELPFYYHPTRSMGVFVENNLVGFIGQLYPSIFGIKETEPIFLFEIFLDSLPTVSFCKIPFRKQLLPCVQRDFSFIVNANVLASSVKKVIENSVPDFLSNVLLFDIFNLSDEKKSLAFRVWFIPKNKTFTSDEIDSMSQKIIFSVEQFGGILRKE